MRALRLIAAGDVAPVNTDLIPNYAERARGAQEPAAQHASTASPYGVPHGRGANLLDVPQRRGARRRPTRGTSSGTTISSAVQGQDLRLRQPDLHRRRCRLPQGDAARPRDRRTRTSSTRSSSTRPSTCSRSRRRYVGEYWSAMPRSRSRRSRTATAPSGRPGRTRQPAAPARSRRCPSTAILPKEGSTGWSDTWMIYVEGEEPELHVPLDGSHDLAGGATRRRPSTSARRRSSAEACDLTTDRTTARRSTPTTRTTSRRSTTGRRRWRTAATTRDDVCKDYSEWTTAWTEIRG